MRRIITVFSLFFLNNVYSQNLIINGGFENYTTCPNNQGQLNLASPWTSARGTCDLYNTCNNGLYDVPSNQVGTQSAHTGNGYAGFFATQGYFETREYLHAQLSSPLVAGTEYCVKFYVVLADSVNSWGDNDYDVAVNDLGMYIGNTPYTPNPNLFTHLSVTPQIINNSSVQTLSDRINWMEISGTYTALGGEQYITIGSFAPQATQDTTWLDIWNSNNIAYYLVDDVSLMDCSINPMTASISGNNQICEGDSVVLSATVTGGLNPYSYAWSGGQTTSQITVYPQQSQTYSIQITDSLGNTTSTQFLVNVTSNPLVSAGTNQIICSDSIVELTANGQGSILWSTGEISSSIIVSPEITTTYWVNITANGCTNADSVVVIVNSCAEMDLLIPNVFTPDANGQNDFFNLVYFNGFEYTGKIFDRWGLEVGMFDNTKGWDGKNKNGIDCTPGVYFYVLNAISTSKENKVSKGTIELLR